MIILFNFHYSKVRKLLDEGRVSVHDTTEEGESLLSLACSAGYYELAQVNKNIYRNLFKTTTQPRFILFLGIVSNESQCRGSWNERRLYTAYGSLFIR